MVCAQSKNDLNRLLPALGNNGNSVLLRCVELAIGKTDRAWDVMN